MRVVNQPGNPPLNGVSDLFTNTEIENQLPKILSSIEFHATTQQRAFLTFVVTKTLAGNSHIIKGYSVATEVFSRDENFDQATDPIVSIQANKLRRSLERYYLLSGKEDTIHIDIPKGTYVPVFLENKSAAIFPRSRRRGDQQSCPEDAWPTVLIKPFHNLTNDPGKDYWCTGFATELAMEINRFQSIKVLQYRPGREDRRCSDNKARFVVEGYISGVEKNFKVLVNLTDVKSHLLLWSDAQHFDGDISQIIHHEEEVARTVAVKVAGEQGGK